MAKFMLAYYGGKQPSSKEEGMAHREKWMQWVNSLGDKVVNPGTPFPASKLVTSSSVEDDTDPNAMKGFAMVEVSSMDEAIEVAKSDPFLGMEGTIRVSELMEMPS